MSDSDLKDPDNEKEAAAKRWYALYQVSKKSPPTSPAGRASSDDEACCTSLSVLASNLPGGDEICLRIFMAKKIDKGSLLPGGASLIATLTFNDSANEAKFAIHSKLLNPEWLKNDTNQSDSSPKGFLVCYGSSVPQELESFQTELDEHSDGLNRLLDAKLSGLASAVTPRLEAWNEVSIQYVFRAVNVLKQNLARVLHATLTNAVASFEGFSPDCESDIQKFMNACCIQWVDKPVASNVAINLSRDVSGAISIAGIDSSVPFFCHHWAGAVHSISDTNRGDSAVSIKSVVEEYKLKVIQDVNNMRRLTQKANDDYYALYKALVFLKHTGNAAMILRLLRDESICSDDESSSKSANVVIGILEEFLSAQ